MLANLCDFDFYIIFSDTYHLTLSFLKTLIHPRTESISLIQGTSYILKVGAKRSRDRLLTFNFNTMSWLCRIDR